MKRGIIRWHLSAVIALMSGLTLMCTAVPASAESGEDTGTSTTLLNQLDTAARAYNDAKAILDASLVRQTAIDAKLRDAEQRLAAVAERIGAVANAAYRGGTLSLTAALLDDERPDNLLRGVATVSYLAARDDATLREYNAARREYIKQRTALESEIGLQQEQTSQMEQRKNEALRALGAAGGGGMVDGVPVPTPTATPAPRNPDGSWPHESCSVNDPTTNGCITPRTMHALTEAGLAGFTLFTACYRPGDRFEHPKGRACDFSPAAGGFQSKDAAGPERTYGDRLAGWFVGNADRLGVLYVIWYRQVWLPGIGWKSYSRAGGDPASDHTNHVHLSIQ